MALNFPISPLQGDTYDYNGVTYTYDGTKWIGNIPTSNPFDQSLNTTDQVQFADSHVSGTARVDNSIWFSNEGQVQAVNDVVIKSSQGTNNLDWRFGADSNMTVPGDILATPSNDLNLQVFDPGVVGAGVAISLQNRNVDTGSKTTQFDINPNDIVLTTDFQGAQNTWTFNKAGHLVPGSDILQDIGTATNRVRHLYVGPGSISIGDSILSESVTGKLVVPGLTRATALHADEVEDTADQTRAWSGPPFLMDSVMYALNSNLGITVPGNFVPGDYSCSLDGEGYIDRISVDTAGTWDQATADYLRQNGMYAYIGSNVQETFNASHWVQIPFRVRSKADDVEYDFQTGGGAGSITVGTVDSQGSLNNDTSGITTIAFDEASGFSVTELDGNVMKVSVTGGGSSGNVTTDRLVNGLNTVSLGAGASLNFDYDGTNYGTAGQFYDDFSVTSGNSLYLVANTNNTSKFWTFNKNGNLELPAGGDITRGGVSVLGGGGGGNPFDQNLNTTDRVTFDGITLTGGGQINPDGGSAISIQSTNGIALNDSVADYNAANVGDLTLTQLIADTNGLGGLVVNLNKKSNTPGQPDSVEWKFDKDGAVTFPDGTIQTTAYIGSDNGISISNTAPAGGDGKLWFNTTDARTYIKYNGAYVDTNPTVIPKPETDVTFDSITFPDDTVQTTAWTGSIPESLTVTDISFDANTTITGNAGVLTLPGDMMIGTLWPTHSGGDKESVVWAKDDAEYLGLWYGGDQTYPTQNYGPVAGIMIGSIADSTDDFTNTPTAPGTGITIGVNDSNTGNTLTWVFDNNGNLMLPNGGDIVDSNGVSVLGAGSTNPTELVVGLSTRQQLRIVTDNSATYIQPGNGVDGSTGIIKFAPWMYTQEAVSLDTATGNIITIGDISINGEGKGLIVDASGLKRFGFMKYSGIEGSLVHSANAGNAVPFRIGRTSTADVTAATVNDFTTEIYVGTNGCVRIGDDTVNNINDPTNRLEVNGNIKTSTSVIFNDNTAQTTAYRPVTAPTTSKGTSGNKAGMVAYSGSWFYYCTTDYTDGVADIWVRSAWDQTSWS